MCKHKSGGMSKPTGTNTQDGMSERSTASVPSQNCPQSTNGVCASHGFQSALPIFLEQSCSSMVKEYAVTNATAHAVPLERCNRPCDTFNFLPKNIKAEYIKPCTSTIFMPNVKKNHEELTDAQESDEDTEHSPMLLKDADLLCYDIEETWSSNREGLEDTMVAPNHYNPCDLYTCPSSGTRDKFITCDNFLMYSNHRPQPTVQDPVPFMHPSNDNAVTCPTYMESTITNYELSSVTTDLRETNYLSKPKKKWLISQKCKSADSYPDSFNEQFMLAHRNDISYYRNCTNVLEMHSEPNPYLKTLYMNNSDPIAGPSGLQRPCSINWDSGANNLDGEFRSRSYSLTPTVNFAVFEAESSSEAEDIQEPMVPEVVTDAKSNCKTIDDIFEFHNMPLGKVIPISSSAAQLSIASSYGDNGSSICKICHMSGKENDPLISPCRCSGTMQYIHCGCLMRWLEVCHKRGRRPASCELCQYQYHWHKKFKVRHWQFPQCSRKDKILHLLFIFSVLLMVSCAALTIMFFKHDKGTKIDMNQELTESEIGNLVCGVLFFVAFFVAIYVEAKSHDTLYKLLVKFIHINQQWYIDEYEKKEAPPVAV